MPSTSPSHKHPSTNPQTHWSSMKGFRFLPPQLDLKSFTPHPGPSFSPCQAPRAGTYTHTHTHTHHCQKLWRVWDLPHLQANNWITHSFMDASRSHETPGSETKGWLLTGHQADCTSAHSAPVSKTPAPTAQHEETREPLLSRWFSLKQRNAGLREPEFCVMTSEHACSLFWKKTLLLSSKTDCSANILKKITENKEQSVYSQDKQKHKSHMESCLPTATRR